MTDEFRLSVSAAPSVLPTDADHTFYWPGVTHTVHFSSNVGPSLAAFGEVNPRNVDLVRIASGVLAADRSAPRSRRLASWNARSIGLSVEVLEPEVWQAVHEELASLLNFLTGDRWQLDFTTGQAVEEQLGVRALDAERIVLLSGGADSGAGALLSALELNGSGKQALLSQWSAPALAPLQRHLRTEIDRVAGPVTVDHVQVRHSRGRIAPNGTHYSNENSTRSRSLLFIALGLALASVRSVPLLIPENGYASINPPLGPNRRGSLSTKTTHPAFFARLRAILASVGAHSDFNNPYADWTKGEMFGLVRDRVGSDEASVFLSATVSCSHTGARSFGVSPHVSCGECFGCLLRRASFAASGIADRTEYLDARGNSQVEAWLREKSVVQAMRDFLATPLSERDLAVLRIPEKLPLATVLDLCERARDELRSLAL